MALACVLALLLPAWPAAAGQQSPDPPQQTQADKEAATEPSTPWFVMDAGPSFRFGEAVRLDVITLLDADVRESNELDIEGGTFEMGHTRLGVEGRLFDAVGFEIEADLRDDDQHWRDVFVELRQWRAVRIRGGRFKLPFGAERMTSIRELPLIYRSLATEALTPARDTGVEAYGRLLGDVLAYRGGVFAHDGDVSRRGTDAPGSRTFAGGVTLAPFAGTGVKILRDLEIGGATTVGDVPAGLNGLRARTVGGFEAFAPLYVAGRRVRLAADARWARGPVVLNAEFLQVRDERLAQGLSDEDLPDVVARGWYASGAWTILGALRSNGTGPRRGLVQGGFGAIQLAARAESLGFGSSGSTDEAFRNPRAANVFRNDVRAETYGVNWYPVQFVKLQFNLVREHLEDPERRPDPERAYVFSRLFRLQFAW
jgi:phosphate-selective porin